jgi:hypothetical protein
MEVLVKHITGLTLALVSFSALAAPLEINQPWRNISDPIIMSTTFVRSFSSLPVQAAVTESHKYWSGDYWALKKGNINYRWFSPKPQGFNLKSPTKEQASTMTLEELSYLAPSEKFDLLNGRYDYPLVKEVSAFTSPEREIWEGMCHGWAPALMHHSEPLPKVMTNADGIQIPFGSSDIKALISYYYAYEYDAVTSRQMGSRCNSDMQWPWSSDRCEDDMNAGAFHIVLTNKIGLAGTSFVADIENGKEVWNHVPVRYQMTIVNDQLPPERDSAKGTVKTVRIKAEVFYVFNSDKNTWEVSGQIAKKRSYEYTLDLNKSGMIIGGNWISKMRPDFLWLVDQVPAFNPKFEKLTELLNDD